MSYPIHTYKDILITRKKIKLKITISEILNQNAIPLTDPSLNDSYLE